MQIDSFQVKQLSQIDVIGVEQRHFKTRICIATEEILGPVRNGGIASTYYHLAKGLAAHGHEVHVLMLKGPFVQDETPEHWVEHFAAFGVTLHYLDVAREANADPASHWRTVYHAGYRWLKERPAFDIIHTSEWRGGMLYALMAKRLGLAFQNSLFVVKTSSPHLWNRHYQMQPIERPEKVAVCYAEQKCVELADIVIGGSAHLISFMEAIGYRLPSANIFAQPNIIDFSEVPVTDQRPPRQAGDRVLTRELVFFGRLEARKGLDLFCSALDILQQKGIAPARVTFLGKFGARLAAHGGVAPEEYLRAKAGDWPFPVEIVTNRNQPEALSLMCSRDMIAVMPSLIENSTMAVYEALENRIPFIATAVGGTAELVAPEHHRACLIPPRAQALAEKLEQVFEEGQVIPRASFSNERNLQVWYGFHNYIGRLIADEGAEATVRHLTRELDGSPEPVRSVAYVAFLRAAQGAGDFAEAMIADPPDEVVLVLTDPGLERLAEDLLESLGAGGIAARLLTAFGHAVGEALSAAVSSVQTDAVIVADGLRVRPLAGFSAMCRQALSRNNDMFVTSFVRDRNGALAMPLGGDVATQFLTSDAYGPEVIVLRRARIECLGSFEPYNVRQGILHEYVTRNAEHGADLIVCPEPLLECDDLEAERRRRSGDGVYDYLKVKPLIDSVGLNAKKIILSTVQLGRRADALEERRELFRRKAQSLQERVQFLLGEGKAHAASLKARLDRLRADNKTLRARGDELRAEVVASRASLRARADRERRLIERKEAIRSELIRTRKALEASQAKLRERNARVEELRQLTARPRTKDRALSSPAPPSKSR